MTGITFQYPLIFHVATDCIKMMALFQSDGERLSEKMQCDCLQQYHNGKVYNKLQHTYTFVSKVGISFALCLPRSEKVNNDGMQKSSTGNWFTV